MVYVALLRGINVGGKNKVEMKRLKQTFERLGLRDVATYINSGNVIFSDDLRKPQDLSGTIEKAIEKDFGFAVEVLIRSKDDLSAIADTLPDTWVNDQTMKCDVMFLWEEVASPKVLNGLSIKPEIEDVKYTSGAIIWRVDKKNVTKSGMMKLVGTQLYKKMTIRNCNTVRKLLSLMN